jgi:hypothetical protein
MVTQPHRRVCVCMFVLASDLSLDRRLPLALEDSTTSTPPSGTRLTVNQPAPKLFL